MKPTHNEPGLESRTVAKSDFQRRGIPYEMDENSKSKADCEAYLSSILYDISRKIEYCVGICNKYQRKKFVPVFFEKVR